MEEKQVPFVLVDGYEFGDVIEDMKRQHTGLILGNVNDGSRIAKHGMDLGKIKELGRKRKQDSFYQFQQWLFRRKRSVPLDSH